MGIDLLSSNPRNMALRRDAGCALPVHVMMMQFDALWRYPGLDQGQQAPD
ncbi:hypothetical protein [Acidisoma silvae]|uniref:Uncharacterized protein n=1 Tax=Acidisoma silvae TaxID=2802396 RepID=A0A963YVI8_9PROT|nr:hypothetical protein [Acidisoma silvae]MCB8877894.1 hypothetical protein [Acidisoma silvae]